MPPKFSGCGDCTRCCRALLVNITLVDVQRMAEAVGIPPEEAFARYVVPEPPREHAFFVLTKETDGRCHHLTEAGVCGIYDARPVCCRTYHCDQRPPHERGAVKLEHGDMHNNAAGRKLSGEFEHAKAATRKYMQRHGGHFHAGDYAALLSEALDAIADGHDDRVRFAKGPAGDTWSIAYNCRHCTTRSNCCTRTALTLDDVRRLAAHLELAPAAFWERHLAREPSGLQEGLLALRTDGDGHCGFLERETHRCTVEAAQPRFCAFVPCPKYAHEEQMYARYFMGAGSVSEQFRHDIAEKITKAYTQAFGARFVPKVYAHCLAGIDANARRQELYDDYLAAIEALRFVTPDNAFAAAPVAAAAPLLAEAE